MLFQPTATSGPRNPLVEIADEECRHVLVVADDIENRGHLVPPLGRMESQVRDDGSYEIPLNLETDD